MSERPIIASGIEKAPHFRAFDDLSKERIEAIDASRAIVYLIDSVTAGALPILAEQFNVDGIKGFAFAETENDQRDIVRRAFQIVRKKGTPQSVRDIIHAYGHENVVLFERLESHWADFDAVVVIGDIDYIESRNRIIIEEHKPARSILVNLDYGDLLDGLSSDRYFETAVRDRDEDWLDVYGYGDALVVDVPGAELTYRGQSWSVELVGIDLEGDIYDGLTGERIEFVRLFVVTDDSLYIFAYNTTIVLPDTIEQLTYRGQSWSVDIANFEIKN